MPWEQNVRPHHGSPPQGLNPIVMARGLNLEVFVVQLKIWLTAMEIQDSDVWKTLMEKVRRFEKKFG